MLVLSIIIGCGVLTALGYSQLKTRSAPSRKTGDPRCVAESAALAGPEALTLKSSSLMKFSARLSSRSELALVP